MKRRDFSPAMPLVMCLFGLSFFSSCDVIDDFRKQAIKVDRYEKVSLYLAKENRELKAHISLLKTELQTIKSEKSYLQSQLGKYERKGELDRGLASIAPLKFENDLVQYEIYKWKPDQMLAMAGKEFSQKNYEKAAQFYRQFTHEFPKDPNINDELLFKAGVAAFESGKHHDWTLMYLDRLVQNYPTSKLYRGAKLWMALTYLKVGKEDQFFNTVEEFRKKYRNTDEWEILSHQYETIVQKYKRN